MSKLAASLLLSFLMLFSTIAISLITVESDNHLDNSEEIIHHEEISYSSNNSTNSTNLPPNPISISFGSFMSGEVRIAVNDTTGEYHVLTMSDHSGAMNGNNNNGLMVAQNYSRNGNQSNSHTTYDFNSEATIPKRNAAITPSGEIIVYKMWWRSNECKTQYNTGGGYKGQYSFFNDTNLNESNRIYSFSSCADSPIAGFVSVGDKLIHSTRYQWYSQIDQSYPTFSRADFKIVSKPTQNNGNAVQDSISISCSASGTSGCHPAISFVGSYGNHSLVIDYVKGGNDGTSRRMVWSLHNDTTYELDRQDQNEIAIGIDSQKGIIVANSSAVYYQDIYTGARNLTSINQSILSSLPHQQNPNYDYVVNPVFVDSRGDILYDNWYIQPDTGKIIQYIGNWHYSSPLALLENSGVMPTSNTLYYYDWDRDAVNSPIDNCKSSPITYTGPDFEGDGCYDFEDTDDDNDGYSDIHELTDCGMPASDPFNNSDTPSDLDNDWICDNLDSDDDNDGWLDIDEQNCSTDPRNSSSVPADNDGDWQCDLVDQDDDNDGVPDTSDLAPFDPEASGPDTDGDGLVDNITSTHPYYTINNWTGNMTEYLNSSDWHTASYTAEPSWVWDDVDSVWSIPKDNYSLLVSRSLDDANNSITNGSHYIAFMGEGNYSITYNWSDSRCGFDILMNEHALSPSIGNHTLSGLLLQGNHTLKLNVAESNETDCNEDTVKIFSIILPHEGITQLGLYADTDDDNDGFADLIESEGMCGIQSDPLSNISTPPDMDGDHICDSWDTDIDGDMYNNSEDDFPLDATEHWDLDGDGIGNNADVDDDGDGYNDTSDPWPLDNCVGQDHDSDGLADAIIMNCVTSIAEDGDDDNDNILDQDDFCPTGELNWLSGAVTDHDADGCRDDGEDLDDDNDGLNDLIDLCPRGYVGWVSNPTVDADSDGCHDSIEDNDDDNDGVIEPGDQCPNTPSGVIVDTQGCPLDSDGDGVADYLDSCSDTPSGVTVDSNGCPIDSDGDGTPDYVDDFPNDADETVDSDGDGVGDNTDAFPNDGDETLDSDGDGVGDNSDAFPNDSNETVDSDGDGVGDSGDQCPATTSEDTVGSDGCVFQTSASASSGLGGIATIGIVLAVLLAVVAVGTILLRMRMVGVTEKEPAHYSEESRQTAPSEVIESTKSQPPAHELQGARGDDGYYWLEWPEGSGTWYYRGMPGDQWTLFEK